ncbi:MAG: hypothetical protein AVO33_04665 [delta proteobacterium ML8_F1]|nr:MAG: hypothetical protein AVO33_04665 [delta proteobacterium ML8_F1]
MAKGEIPQLKAGNCMSCGICEQACPFGCLALEIPEDSRNKRPLPRLVTADCCTGCEICVKACPLNCLVMEVRT